MVDRDPFSQIHRRVGGWHDYRMDGLGDLLGRAAGASVMDLGCNRGMIAYEFAYNGAKLVHGCDHSYEDGVKVAQQVFADMRHVNSRFEVVDLSKGVRSLSVFGDVQYDIVLMFGVYHKLKRQMSADLSVGLLQWCAKHATKYFAWRGFAEEIPEVDHVMKEQGFHMVQWTDIGDLGPGAIWKVKS